MTRDALRRVDVGNRRLRPVSTYEDPIRGAMDYRAKLLILQPNWQGLSALNLGYVSAWIHQAIVACALERYRLDHGKYPANLQTLVPRFLVSIPSDPVRPGPLHYRLNSATDADSYTLSSAGPDTMIAAGTRVGDDWTWSPSATSGSVTK